MRASAGLMGFLMPDFLLMKRLSAVPQCQDHGTHHRVCNYKEQRPGLIADTTASVDTLDYPFTISVHAHKGQMRCT